MSQKDSQYNAISSILNSIDNIADKVLEYQSGKSHIARSFARKIDNLIYMKQQEEQQEKKMVCKSKEMDVKDKENSEILNLKKRINELMEKMNELKEKMKSGKTDDIEFDVLDNDRPIDTLAIVEGILSSPSGDDVQFLATSIQYLHQKNSERVKELTIDHIQEVRNTFLMRLAQDSKLWDQEIREMMQSLIVMTTNVAMSIKKSARDQNTDDLQEVADKLESIENKIPKYRV